jgi:hypothetical protein
VRGDMIMEIKISKEKWKENNEWIKKNPSERLIALFYPSSKRIVLVRSSNPYEYYEKGYEVEYPDYMQKTLSIPGFVSEEDIVLNLEWV